MPFVLGLLAGGFGGYGAYVGWLTGIGIAAGSVGVAILVGTVLFVLAALFGVFILMVDY